MLALALRQWKLKKALELLKEKRITIRKAAKMVGVTYSEMLMSKEGIDIGYSLKELERDIKWL